MGRVAALLSEFVGTFMLVLTVGCVSLSKSKADFAPTSVALALTALVYCFGTLSGGHLNPAVTLAAGLVRKFSWLMVAAYIAVQTAAGFAAGVCARALFAGDTTMGPKAPFSWWEAMVVEALYTCMLAFVVLSVTSRRNNPESNPNQFYGLAIGFVLVAAGHAAGPVSGAALNPAVTVGMGAPLGYLGWQAVGSMVAALLFRLTRPEEYKSDDEFYAYEPVLPTRLASEFIGTFMVALTMGLNVLGKSPAAAWSAAAAMMSMIYALGDVSGGHFNPAVTVAVVASGKGKCSVWAGCFYMLFQVIAGMLASLVFAGIHQAHTFPVLPESKVAAGAACVLELFFTFVLSFVVLSTLCVKGISTELDRNYYFALAVGSCVTAGSHASQKASTGYLNPAVSFGVGVADTLNSGRLSSCATICMAELCGGLLAAIIFFLTHAREYKVKPFEEGKFTG